MDPSTTNPFLLLVLVLDVFVALLGGFLLLPAEQTEICGFIVSVLFIHSEFIQKQKPHLCPILKN